MIIAVDFDGTLCESCFPEIGRPNLELIRRLKANRLNGDKLILWTCRTRDNLAAAIAWCRSFGLSFDAVNENLPEILALYGGDSRKIFADVYIDDRSVYPWEFALSKAL